jgi:predicted XRE-type DNA-binding protein
MSMSTRKTARSKKSHDNIHAELRLRKPHEERAKAKLVERICAVIDDRGLTQTQAAKVLGMDQPKISALVCGKLDGFSAGRLFRILHDLGQEVEVIVKATRRR